MDTSALDVRIRRADVALEQLRARAETAASNVRVQACIFVKDWIQTTITRQVTAEPEVSKGLGLEGLGKLKQELADLCNRLSRLVDQDLGADALWPHRLEEIHRGQIDWMSGNRPPDALDEAVRVLLGHAGELIVRYGFQERGHDSSWENRGGRWRYRYGYELSAPFKGALETYNEVYKQARRAAEECQVAKRAKEQAEASDLWNQA